MELGSTGERISAPAPASTASAAQTGQAKTRVCTRALNLSLHIQRSLRNLSVCISPSLSLQTERSNAKSKTLLFGWARALPRQGIPMLFEGQEPMVNKKKCINFTYGSCTLNADIRMPKIIASSSSYMSPALTAFRHVTFSIECNFIVFREGLSFSNRSHGE